MDLIDQFYNTVYKARTPLKTVYAVNTPHDMIVGNEPDSEGWIEWRLIRRSETIDPALAEFEQEIGHPLPHLFKQWHSRYYTLDGDIGIARLPEIPSNDSLRPLRTTYRCFFPDERLYNMGLIPFGNEAMMDAGPLCFDTRVSISDANWPIIYWDHEWANTNREIGPAIFSSFGKLLECAIHYWAPGIQDGKMRTKRIRDFFEIDPTGAGGPGKSDWKTWCS
jgi:hypothetical protein